MAEKGLGVQGHPCLQHKFRVSADSNVKGKKGEAKGKEERTKCHWVSRNHRSNVIILTLLEGKFGLGEAGVKSDKCTWCSLKFFGNIQDPMVSDLSPSLSWLTVSPFTVTSCHPSNIGETTDQAESGKTGQRDTTSTNIWLCLPSNPHSAPTYSSFSSHLNTQFILFPSCTWEGTD